MGGRRSAGRNRRRASALFAVDHRRRAAGRARKNRLRRRVGARRFGGANRRRRIVADAAGRRVRRSRRRRGRARGGGDRAHARATGRDAPNLVRDASGAGGGARRFALADFRSQRRSAKAGREKRRQKIGAGGASGGARSGRARGRNRAHDRRREIVGGDARSRRRNAAGGRRGRRKKYNRAMSCVDFEKLAAAMAEQKPLSAFVVPRFYPRRGFGRDSPRLSGAAGRGQFSAVDIALRLRFCAPYRFHSRPADGRDSRRQTRRAAARAPRRW